MRSQSLASLRHRPSHARVRSTTHRLAITTKPATPFGRLMISIVGLSNVSANGDTPALELAMLPDEQMVERARRILALAYPG